jgi:hypothetical protein
MIKMFRIRTRVADFGGFKDVDLDWFVVERPQRLFGADGALGIDYHEVIADYDATLDRRYSEDALEEMFTAREAEIFAAWLKANRPANDGNTAIRERALPINNNEIGFGAISVGGLQDFMPISKSADYSLPFKVWGYYDKRFCCAS